MKKIILANAPINNGNRGCVALSITMMSLIDEVMRKANQEYELFLTDSQFLKQEKHVYKIKGYEIQYDTCGYPKGLSLKDDIKLTLKAIIIRSNKS